MTLNASAKRVSFNLPEIEWTFNNTGKIIDSISEGKVSRQELIKLMINCKNNVEQLTKEHQPLLRALVGSVWPCLDVDIIPHYQDFLANVVSYHPYLSVDVIKTLVNQFSHAPPHLSRNQCSKSWDGEDDLFEIVKSLLDAMMSFSPNFSQTLYWDSLLNCFPYVLKDPNSQASYARHLMRLCTFNSDDRTGLLDVLLKQMVRLDLSMTSISGVHVDMKPWSNQELAHAYIGQVDQEDLLGDTEVHGPFYAVCQAIFDILGFRHGDLISMGPKAVQFLQSLQFSRIVNSSLNPLRNCHKGTVLHFVKMSRSSQLVNFYTVIEGNYQSTEQRLPPFLFFDEYLLPHSGWKVKASVARKWKKNS